MPIRHATLHQLKIFDSLARHMNVARTAEALNLTPPAISIQVKQLSETVGLPLLEQIGKQLYLTEAGKIVAVACHDLFDRLEQLSQELMTYQGMEKGVLRVSILTTAKYFVPRLLGEFSKQHPGIDVSLFVGNRKALLERLAINDDDLYILGEPPASAKVHAIPFAPNPAVVIAHPDHPLVGETAIAPARLANESFIAREEGSGTRLACEDFFRRHRTQLRIWMEMGSNEAIKQTVAAQLGISVVSRNTVLSELANGELALLDVKGFPLERKWYVVCAQKKFLTPAATAFRTFLISHFDPGNKTIPALRQQKKDRVPAQAGANRRPRTRRGAG
ncbi:MAG: LysR family transcriptional regulator [Thiogranum sp.]|nr:LysR family transcriptional regulator [Thiogranum sp.]